MKNELDFSNVADNDQAARTARGGEGEQRQNQDTSVVASFIEYAKPCGKGFTIEDGQWSKANLPRNPKATARTIEFPDFSAFADFRLKAGPKLMQVTGTFAAADDGKACMYGNSVTHEAVAATKEFLAYRDQSGTVIIDTDVKDAGEVRALFPTKPPTWSCPEEFIAALEAAVPELAEHPVFCIDSTSARIHAGDNWRKLGDSGFHTIYPVERATESPSIQERLHFRLLAAGLGWGFVAEDGQIHIRTPVDLALRTVTQPNFCAPALGKGINQDRRSFLRTTGRRLSLADIEWDTEHHAAALKAQRDIAEQLMPMSRTIKKQHNRTVAKKALNKTEVTDREIAEVFARLEKGDIQPGMVVTFVKPDETLDVADLILDGAKYNGRECLDPMRPGYDNGRAVAKFYWNNGLPIINSFASGSHALRLVWTPETYPRAGDIVEATKALSRLTGTPAQIDVILKSEATRLHTTATMLKEDIGLHTSASSDFAKELGGREDAEPSCKDGVVYPPPPKFKDGSVFPEDRPLPIQLFPHTRMIKGDLVPIMHISNVDALLRGYGISIHYDVILKEQQTNHVGGDNAGEALRARILSLCNLNRMPTENLTPMLTGIADRKPINPVVDYLKALQWDGTPRIRRFAEAASEEETAEIAFRLFFLGACAAADGAVTGMAMNPVARATFEYVMVLVGRQGAKKTSTLRGMIPAALHRYVKTGVMLKVGDKDSEKQAISYWVVELGEMESTFRKSDITDMKNFLSRDKDELRLPYAQSSSKYPRRTQFAASVNGSNFLLDLTGNRRYMPVVTQGMPTWSTDEIDQLWAEAWSMYASGRQWWPDDAEEALLFAKADEHTEKSHTEELLLRKFDWSAPPQNSTRWPSGMLFNVLHGRPPNDRVQHLDARKTSEILRKLWGIPSGGNRTIKLADGSEMEIYAEGGKKRGFLMPPLNANETIGGPPAGADFAMSGEIVSF